jgi:deoxyadenosine/deoxycytidine kinase
MPKVIFIEGTIGAGKSTFIQHMKKIYNNDVEQPNSKKIIFLQEPVDRWNTLFDKNHVSILEQFYEDQEKYAFSFQMFALKTRIEQFNNALDTAEIDDVIVCERSVTTDRYIFAELLYETGQMNDYEYTIYKEWFDMVNPLNDERIIELSSIYLRVTPQNAFQHIIARQRNGEDNIHMEYLKILHEKHEQIYGEDEFGVTIEMDNYHVDTEEYTNLIHLVIDVM